MVLPYHLIDLTHTLHPGVPTWSGDCGFMTQAIGDDSAEESPVHFCLHQISSMQAGIGTHLDAPAHLQPSGKTIDEIPLSDLCWPCVVLDFSTQGQASFVVSLEQIQNWERQYGLIPKKAVS